jgi:hypothetical protein
MLAAEARMALGGVLVVAFVGITAARWGARGRVGWISAGLLATATLYWFAVEALLQVVGTDNPEQFTRGEWLALLRVSQLFPWLALLAASQLVYIGPMRRRIEAVAA